MSNLLVQNIKHTNNTSAQTIDSSGRTTAVLNNDTTYRSDGGAVTKNMVQGLCKAWCDWNQQSTQTIRDSYNISGITDGGTGKTTLNINNDMSNDDWAGVLYQNGNATDGFDNHYAGGLESKTTGSVLMTGYASNLVDSFTCDLIVMGDLA
jgi:hypothetical protein